MELALELSITPQLDKDNLIEQESDKVKRLCHVMGLLCCVRHCSLYSLCKLFVFKACKNLFSVQTLDEGDDVDASSTRSVT